MNIITIDPSLSCSAVIVNDEKFIYTTYDIATQKKSGNLTKWFELCDPLITYRFHTNINNKNHQQSEIAKLNLFNEIVEKIKADIQPLLKPNEATTVAIEGYSHSSNAGPLIDLVTFGTLVRNEMFNITKDIYIIPPTLLKAEAAKLTYPAIEKGVRVKSYEWRNNEGIAGGKFTKIEMYKALIENDTLQDDWLKMLRDNKDEILSLKSIHKPIEDMNDAKLLYEIMLRK